MMLLLRRRSSRALWLISAGFAFAVSLIMSQQLPVVTRISLWRPIELFGPGFLFSVDKNLWPFLLLGSAAVLAAALLDGGSAVKLLYSGVALAAIAGENLLTIAMLWTLMISMETAVRIMGPVDIKTYLPRSRVQFVAVAAVVAAATLGEDGVALLALAALIRSLVGTETRFPLSLAIMAPLGALAAVSRYSPDLLAFLWIAGVVIAIVLARPLLSKIRLPRVETAQRFGRQISASMAVAVRAAAEVLEGESAVLWILLALLIAIIGLQTVAV